MRSQRPLPARQRGAALLLAMIIVTLIATLAASMIWQQWRAIQVETAERSRSQSAWILSGALNWAGLILSEDFLADARKGRIADDLSEPWAVPLAEARLSTFIAVDKDNADDAPEAFLSGTITDAQSRFNLRNLVDGNQLSAPDVEVLRRLCENVNVAASAADLLAKGMKDASAPPSTNMAPTDPPLMPKRIDQLTWLGLDAQTVHRLEPYVVLLPERTTININTAAREVIAAAIPGLNVGDAERLVQYRVRTPFAKQLDIQAQLPALPPDKFGSVDVMSRFFEVRGKLRLSDRVLEQRSVVQRNQRLITVISSERVSSNDTDR